ncbi:hypothetical protein [Paracoccus aerodenitrificans]|uniref:hypothetical protein n=1 Tax=Paracoccus aerodenitrificans TaxID=3017781 RepID=UPI0022F11494|nr:hypothetical protein [Paracoccus aerodenitrificans]WBU64927.1 hypothetical protein PAE61_05700 [Paracoccus aerodenitrificans]
MKSQANKRYRIVQDAIEARLLDGANRREKAEHIHAVIAGATMQWIVSDGSVGLSNFVLQRLDMAINLND